MKNKRFYLFLFVCVMLVFSGCKKKEETNIRTVRQDAIGLEYTAPQQWEAFEESNILPPFSSATPDADIFAQIEYDFATEEILAEMAGRSPEESIDDLKLPICEIAVVKEDKKESEGTKKRFAQFDTIEEVGNQQGFFYYVLSNYNGQTGLSEADTDLYEKIKTSVPALTASIRLYSFDTSAVEQKIETFENTISFVTKTLEGQDIDNTIFSRYDLTMVNFWASYCYPQIDETKTLQELSKQLEKDYNVGFLQVVIDIPADAINTSQDWKTAMKAKQDQNADFTSIVPDSVLSNWIVNHLEGLPTTVFVDKNGTIIGEPIKEVQTKEQYIEQLKKRLQ